MSAAATSARPARASRSAAPSRGSSRSLTPFLCAITLAAADADSPRQSWVQLFKVGKWWDERYGNFSITPEDLQEIQANFGTPAIVPVDYNHGTSKPTTAEVGKAAGKIESVEIRANGAELWGFVTWTKEAAARIDAKEYLAMSPTFAYGYKHSDGRKLGTTLLAAALCNRPVFDGMAEVAAGLFLASASALALATGGDDEAAEAVFSYDEQRRRVQAALSEKFGLGFPEQYGPCCGCYLVDLFDGRAIYRVYLNDADKTYGVDFAISAAGVVTFTSESVEVINAWTALTQETAMSKVIKISDAAGKEITLTQAQVDAIVKEAGPAPGEVVDLAKFSELQTTVQSQGATITQLSEKNATLELAAKTRDAKEKVEGLIRAGKAAPAERDELVELALSNSALFDKMAGKRPVVFPIGRESGSGGDVEAGHSAALGQLEMAISAELTANPRLSREQAYSRALDKNPKLYEAASAAKQ